MGGLDAYPYVEGIIRKGCPSLEEQHGRHNRASTQKNKHVGADKFGNRTLQKAYLIHDITSVHKINL